MGRNRCSNNCNNGCDTCGEELGLSVRDTNGTYYPVVNGVLVVPAPPKKDDHTVSYAAGPGAFPNNAPSFVGTSRDWWVTDGPTGTVELWCIIPGTGQLSGIEQWHQVI